MNTNDEEAIRRTKLFELIESRKSLYHKALIGVAIIREGYETPQLAYGIVRFLHESEDKPQSKEYDYGKMTIIRHLSEVQEAIDFISCLLEDRTMKLTEPNIALKAMKTLRLEYMKSGSGYMRFLHDWPLVHCELAMDDAKFGSILPTKLNLPYYPDYRDAISDILYLTPGGASPRNIDIFLPDFRGRILRVRVDNERILVDVQVAEAEENDVGVKLYIRYEKETGTSETLKVKDGTAEYTSSMRPHSVDAALILRDNGDLIDNRRFSLVGPPSEDVIMIDPVNRIKQLVDRGEGLNVEFKQTLNTSKEGEYLESVTAFANTEGGFLLVGVNDNCDVTGWSGDTESILTDRISDLCDPLVKMKVTKDIEVEGQLVTMVEVPEGKDKPYILKNRGVMVRIGASDRQIKRRELDKMYEKRENGKF